MQKHYEQLFVIRPTLTPEETQTVVEKVKENITKNSGEIIAFQEIGTQKLAYEIQGNKRGYYGVFYFKLDPKEILEVERILRLSEDVIKFLTVKYESKKEVKAFNIMVNKLSAKKQETATETEEVPAEINE
jgi:small subunit ribosomal protein S6